MYYEEVLNGQQLEKLLKKYPRAFLLKIRLLLFKIIIPQKKDHPKMVFYKSLDQDWITQKRLILLQSNFLLLLRLRHRRKMRRGPTKGCLRWSESFS
jgi:hypothetical protein